MNTLKVSPSTFGFLYDECQRCFYLDTHRLRKRPRSPFPTIFSTIDLSIKPISRDHCNVICGLNHKFRIESKGKWVRSSPLSSSDGGLPLVINGFYDSVLTLRDGSRAICDFKTSPVKPDLVSRDARQLHGYAWALERPQSGLPQRIHRLGLGVFNPTTFYLKGRKSASLSGKFKWVEIPRDDYCLPQIRLHHLPTPLIANIGGGIDARLA